MVYKIKFILTDNYWQNKFLLPALLIYKLELKEVFFMKFNHIHPIYTNETEQKNAVKEKYEKIYGSIIEQRKTNESFSVIQLAV